MRNLWIALESAWRAGLVQFKKMRTRQKNAAVPDPLVPW